MNMQEEQERERNREVEGWNENCSTKQREG